MNESGPIPSIRWEMWRSGLEDTEYFFHLQRLIAQSQSNERGDDGASTSRTQVDVDKKVSEARAALDAVREATWGFAYFSDKAKRNIRPYTTNATLLVEIKRRVMEAIEAFAT